MERTHHKRHLGVIYISITKEKSAKRSFSNFNFGRWEILVFDQNNIWKRRCTLILIRKHKQAVYLSPYSLLEWLTFQLRIT